MISWLIVIVLSYLFFSLSFLGDKLVLSGAPKPKSYTFFICFLSGLVIVLIPFVHFGFPDAVTFLWTGLEAVMYVSGLYIMFVALEKYDVSVVAVTIGAAQPILIFMLTWILLGPITLSFLSGLAFILLIAGSVLISFNRKKFVITGEYIKITLLASFLFSLDYVFSKLVFLHQPFWQGFIWMRIFSFILVLTFLFSRKFRKEIFQKQNPLKGNTKILFVCSQICSATATLLQNFAIFLVPIAFLPVINALRGIQYVFLFIATLFLSFFFPKILKEETSRRAITLKIISIILIVIGLALVSFG